MHTTPTKVLLTTILRLFVVQFSGSLAHEVRLLGQFLHDALTSQKMAEFEWALRALLREVGRRIMTWILNHVGPAHDAEASSRCSITVGSVSGQCISATCPGLVTVQVLKT